MMKKYARIDDGVVAEIFTTDKDITTMFHPSLTWVECSPDVSVGWLCDRGVFSQKPEEAIGGPVIAEDPVQKLADFLKANPDVLRLVA